MRVRARCVTMSAVTQTIDGYSVLAFIPLLVLGGIIATPVARRTGLSWLLLTLTAASVAAILAVTIGSRLHNLSVYNIGAWTIDWLRDGDLWRHSLDVDRGWLLNVALFVPAGALIAHVTLRPIVTFAGLALGSLAIEFLQRRYGLGAADTADLVANSIGAAIGVGIAVAINAARPRPVTEHSQRANTS
jgi:glycopeptide antibiotics resistance protein